MEPVEFSPNLGECLPSEGRRNPVDRSDEPDDVGRTGTADLPDLKLVPIWVAEILGAGQPVGYAPDDPPVAVLVVDDVPALAHAASLLRRASARRCFSVRPPQIPHLSRFSRA